MARLIGLVRPLTGFMVLAIGMGLLGHICASAITILGGFAVVEVLFPGEGGALIGLFAGAMLCAVLRGVLRYGEQACNHFIAFKLLALIRDRVFTALRRLCPAKLEGRDKGDLISVITSDIELLEVFYAHTISPVCIAALFGCGMVMWIGSRHILLGLLAAIAYVTVGGAMPMLASRLSGGRAARLRGQSGALSGFVLDSLRGLPEILQYGCGRARLAQMDGFTDELAGEEQRLKDAAGLSNAVTNTVILLFDFAMLFAASSLCGFADALICTLALMSSFGPFVSLAALGSTLQNTFAAGNRVLDLLEETPVTREVYGRPETQFTGAAAEHVSFSYGGETVLCDVSLDVPKGKIIGISGPSGSGKSTLLRLFMRFWAAQGGRIGISGRDIGEVNTSDLRDMQSLVTQQTHIFHDSIRNNLLIAKPDATDAEIVTACKKAAIHDFIAGLPQGYDTPAGELGDALSGGERQRIGLARAFLHDAPFMLLDEPTSNLDSLSEGAVLKALHEARQGRTVLLVSHRASTMGIADRVISVESGRVS